LTASRERLALLVIGGLVVALKKLEDQQIGYLVTQKLCSCQFASHDKLLKNWKDGKQEPYTFAATNVLANGLHMQDQIFERRDHVPFETRLLRAFGRHLAE